MKDRVYKQSKMNSSTFGASAPFWSNEAGDEGWLENDLCHRQLLRALPVAVYTCDAIGRVTFFNGAAARLWGREPELNKDLWCGSWKIFKLDGMAMPLEECPMARTIRDGRAIQDEEIVIERPDGTRRRVLPHTAPIRNSAGGIVGAVNTLVDLTATKRSPALEGAVAGWELRLRPGGKSF